MFWYYLKYIIDVFDAIFDIPIFDTNLSSGVVLPLTVGDLVLGFLILCAIFRGFFSHVK